MLPAWQVPCVRELASDSALTVLHILPGLFYKEETEAQQRQVPVPEARVEGWDAIILSALEPRAYSPLKSSLR